jgi:hypothetical protein
MARRARRYHREFLEESRVTSESSLRAVFNQDAVSVAGDVIAFAALALNQLTGSSIPQGVAAVLRGLLTDSSKGERRWTDSFCQKRSSS